MASVANRTSRIENKAEYKVNFDDVDKDGRYRPNDGDCKDIQACRENIYVKYMMSKYAGHLGARHIHMSWCSDACLM